MGYYINQDSKGNGIPASYSGKIDALKADGATVVDGSQFQENLVCVVNNGMFAAAGYCYNENEYRVFREPDGRPKTWLVHPQAKELAK